MRWRWSSLCPLLLLLFKIAKAVEGEEGESGPEDGSGYNPDDSTTINPTNASNEMGCEVSLFFYFINTGKSAAFGCIFLCALRARIRSSSSWLKSVHRSVADSGFLHTNAKDKCKTHFYFRKYPKRPDLHKGRRGFPSLKIFLLCIKG